MCFPLVSFSIRLPLLHQQFSLVFQNDFPTEPADDSQEHRERRIERAKGATKGHVFVEWFVGRKRIRTFASPPLFVIIVLSDSTQLHRHRVPVSCSLLLVPDCCLPPAAPASLCSNSAHSAKEHRFTRFSKLIRDQNGVLSTRLWLRNRFPSQTIERQWLLCCERVKSNWLSFKKRRLNILRI